MILGLEDITLKRHVAQTRSEATGEAVIAAPTSSTVQASVQPLNGKDRQVLPEGLRSRYGKRMYTTTEMFPADQDTGVTGDIVTIDGEDYEVFNVKRERALLKHYKVLALRTQEADAGV